MLIGTLKVLSLRIGQIAISLALSIILVRALGADPYGEYILVLTIVSTIALPVQYGVGQVLIRELASSDGTNADMQSSAALSWGIVTTICMTVLGVCLLWALLYFRISLGVSEEASWFLSAFVLLVGINVFNLVISVVTGRGSVVVAQFHDNIIRPGSFLLLAAASFWVVSDTEAEVNSVMTLQCISVVIALSLLIRHSVN